MKQIILWKRNDRYSGLYTLVDDKHYEWLDKFHWSCDRRSYAIYAVTRIEKKKVYMHQLILPSTNPLLMVDHINQNGLDNQEQNLRLATRTQNQANRKMYKCNTSGYKGVDWWERDKVWRAYISANGVRQYLGYYQTKQEAAKAYNKAATKAFGEFALLNEVVE